ncbi:MAG: response regulator transcription factor [Dehalococcoidia bacterium]
MASRLSPQNVARHMKRDQLPILIVDDEPSVRRVVARALSEAGYATRPVADRASALAALEEERFSLAILDVQLPDGNGFDLCAEIEQRYKLPVVMLTVLGDESDVVRALESGADDYVRKPFSPRELTARVASVLRRAQPPEGAQPAQIAAGALRLDARSYRAQIGSATTALTPTEFRLLSFLAEHAGQVLMHDELLLHVWGAEYAGEHHMLHVSISRLRQKLSRLDAETMIRTVPGLGYELVIAPSS